jgi:hypothetical protein
MFKKTFDTKIKIEKLEEKLSEENCWISEYVFWKEVWASIFVKKTLSRHALHVFIIKWKHEFPQAFRVKIKNRIFIPVQDPIIDQSEDIIVFHAIDAKKRETIKASRRI